MGSTCLFLPCVNSDCFDLFHSHIVKIQQFTLHYPKRSKNIIILLLVLIYLLLNVIAYF